MTKPANTLTGSAPTAPIARSIAEICRRTGETPAQVVARLSRITSSSGNK